MSYYHILVHEEAADWHDTLLFKDLSREELHSPFLLRFISAAQPGASEPISANALRARVIYTVREYQAALEEYFREWDKEAAQASGYPTYSRPAGDRVIAVAGTDITEEFLRSLRTPEPAHAKPSFLASDSGLRSLGHYHITSEVARSYGADYPGIDSRDGRKVTVKTLRKGAQEDLVEWRLRCFRREVRLATRVRHAGILEVLDFGEDGRETYLVVERVEGTDLMTFFNSGERFGTGDAVIVMGELCAALHAVHEAGIVHGNLAPANVIIDSEGYVKLGEFGHARFSGEDAEVNEPESDATPIPTPECAAPELIRGEVIDRRADIFSAGVILYQLLTGEKPFTGPDTGTIMRQILQEDPPPPSSLKPGISPLYDEVVRKALAKDPADRYQTAMELDRGLQHAILSGVFHKDPSAPASPKEPVSPFFDAISRKPQENPAESASGVSPGIFPGSYICFDCQNEWEVGFTEHELKFGIDVDRTESCSRCGQRVGWGSGTCKKCGHGMQFSVSHWHNFCCPYSTRICEACGEEDRGNSVDRACHC